MRLGGRLAAAIEVLRDMSRRHRPVADALKDWGLSHRFAGSGDRAAIGNIVYDALRRRRCAGWLLDDDTPRAHAFGALILEWGMTAAEINEAVAGDRFAPPPLTPQETEAAASRSIADAPAATRADVPDWCAPDLERGFGAAWVDEAAALARRPPLDMRTNTLLADRAAALEELEGTGARPSELAPHGLRIPPTEGGGRHPNIQVEPVFQKGWIEVQDEGSQVVAELASAGPGMTVLDYCAGAGGKTLAMAAAMQNQGTIHAFDSDKQRLAPIFDRLRRAQATNVDVVARRAALEPLAGSADLVMIDAPCTGSGTWRRRPDAKWRLTEKQIRQRCREQAQILQEASRFVKPGGRLVYITCSVFDAENREQVEAFTALNPEFRAVDHGRLWADKFAHAPGRAAIDAAGIRLTPLSTGTDGFYFAAMQRQE